MPFCRCLESDRICGSSVQARIPKQAMLKRVKRNKPIATMKTKKTATKTTTRKTTTMMRTPPTSNLLMTPSELNSLLRLYLARSPCLHRLLAVGCNRPVEEHPSGLLGHCGLHLHHPGRDPATRRLRSCIRTFSPISSPHSTAAHSTSTQSAAAPSSRLTPSALPSLLSACYVLAPPPAKEDTTSVKELVRASLWRGLGRAGAAQSQNPLRLGRHF